VTTGREECFTLFGHISATSSGPMEIESPKLFAFFLPVICMVVSRSCGTVKVSSYLFPLVFSHVTFTSRTPCSACLVLGSAYSESEFIKKVCGQT